MNVISEQMGSQKPEHAFADGKFLPWSVISTDKFAVDQEPVDLKAYMRDEQQ